MKLEDQVISLPLAKRLKELGVKQKSYAFWILDPKTKGAPETARLLSVDISLSYFINHQEEKTFSAFTVAELGEMLPSTICPRPSKTCHWLSCSKMSGKKEGQWLISYIDQDVVADDFIFEGPSEADARARMLVYLIEKGRVKP